MSSAITKTIVHFYPSSGPVVAPYEVQSRFTLFGEGIETQTIGVEGARLAQPDGVPLEELFADLRNPQATLFGIRIELSSSSARGKLDGSECMIELKSRGSSVKYRAKRLVADQPDEVLRSEQKVFLNLNDKFNSSSLIAVNASSFRVPPLFSSKESSIGNAVSDRSVEDDSTGRQLTGGAVEADAPISDELGLAPFAVQEFNFSRGGEELESRWGIVSSDVITCSEPHAEFAFFSMYKDVSTNRTISVNPL